MSQIKIEVFLSSSNQSNEVMEIIKSIKKEYGDKVEIVTCTAENELYQEYSIASTPAIVIEEMIKFMGFCPSKETIVFAIRSFE